LLRARSYLDWGSDAAGLEIGAITILSRGRDPALGHVGFLVGTTHDSVILLGGNQSNAVTVAAFSLDRVLAFRVPRPQDRRSTNQADTFAVAVAHVLEMEGGWSDDPFDPGGPTNKGITLGDYAREKGIAITAHSYAQLKAELRAIPDALVRDIYLNRYWRPARCPDLPAPIALMHFDAAVNHGVAGAARMLQEALGVDIDGEIGPITLGAARSMPAPAALEAYAAIRRRRYRSLAHFWRFGKGWLRRVDVTLARASARSAAPARHAAPSASSSPRTSTPAQEMQRMPADRTTDFPSIPNAPSEAAPDTKWWGQSMTIWGALLTAMSTVLPLLGPILGLDLTPELVQRLGQDIVVLVQALGGLIGTILTILGRMRATTLLERRPVRLKL
jgi:lysozyme family protein